ncbi:MAG: hypothetical protein NVS9B15_22170 [Acidobacteriaceae bacterium]
MVAYLCAVPVLAFEAVLYAGLTFTAGKNIGFWLRLFLLFGCVFDLPAYVLSGVHPKLAGRWLLVNAGLTLLFMGQFPIYELGAAFCMVRVISGLALFQVGRLGEAEGSSKTRVMVKTVGKVVASAYSSLWVIYLMGTWWYIDRHR